MLLRQALSFAPGTFTAVRLAWAPLMMLACGSPCHWLTGSLLSISERWKHYDSAQGFIVRLMRHTCSGATRVHTVWHPCMLQIARVFFVI